MSIQAKFFVAEITQTPSNQGGRVKLQAVTRAGTDKDNVSWSKYTPSGTIEMQVTNPDAFAFFSELLQRHWTAENHAFPPEVYITISAAEPFQ